MEDKKISDISKLLIRGAKMLSYHCPDCKIPIFQEGDRIFCPSCNRDVIIEGPEDKKDEKEERYKIQRRISLTSKDVNTEKEEVKPEIKMREVLEVSEFYDVDTSLKNAIIRLSKNLEDAKDLKEIKEIVETIDKIASIIERMKKLS